MNNSLNKIAQFEDLSNEVFVEVFEYLHALDLFMAFSSLNSRFSSVLFVPQLRVVVNGLHSRHQIQFLCSCLVSHSHQVISLILQDQLRDFSAVISFFFDQHTFVDLRLCTFVGISPSSNLRNIIDKLQRSNKLGSFQIIQPNDIPLSDQFKQELSHTALKSNSLKLRAIDLSFPYDYRNLIRDNLINSTLTTLRIMFQGSTTPCSIYNVLPILRIYRALRTLYVVISNTNALDLRQIRMPTLLSTYETHPPVLPSLKSFELCIKTLCGFHSLSFILRCMPNLRQFIITIISTSSSSQLYENMFNGHQWEQLLTANSLQLDVFDVLLRIRNSDLQLDKNVVINSFNSFARKYDDWYVAIHQFQTTRHNQKQTISLRGFRHSKRIEHAVFTGMQMVLGTLSIHATAITDYQHHLFNSVYDELHINIPTNTHVVNVPSCRQFYKNISSLIIELDSSMLTFWEDMFDFFRIWCRVSKTNQKQCANQIASLVNLSTVTELEFKPKYDIAHVHLVKDILLACPRVVQLTISSPLIFSSSLSDDRSLTPIWNRLHALYLYSNKTRFPLNYAFKLGKFFQSLVHLELELYPIDACISLVNSLLDGLPKLIHLKIHFHQNQLLGDGTYLADHIIKRRREAFPRHIYHKDEVFVKIVGQTMDIYLNGCSICADKKYSF